MSTDLASNGPVQHDRARVQTYAACEKRRNVIRQSAYKGQTEGF
ncbi:MAG: hypothetical protein ACE37D_11910 [Pseudomonadales bacterium]